MPDPAAAGPHAGGPQPDEEHGDEQVLDFPDGLPGFPHSRRFVLATVAPDSDFRLLQSLDEPDVAMVVAMPWAYFPDYAPELDEPERRDLELESEEDAIVFCPVTLDASTRTAYLNLLGPCVVNARTRRGRQVVLSGSDHPLRAAVPLGAPPAGAHGHGA